MIKIIIRGALVAVVGIVIVTAVQAAKTALLGTPS